MRRAREAHHSPRGTEKAIRLETRIKPRPGRQSPSGPRRLGLCRGAYLPVGGVLLDGRMLPPLLPGRLLSPPPPEPVVVGCGGS
jgi:hypothetical protein